MLSSVRRLLIRSEFLLVAESGGAADHLLYAGAKWALVRAELSVSLSLLLF